MRESKSPFGGAPVIDPSSDQRAVAVLELLARTAGAGFVATDLAPGRGFVGIARRLLAGVRTKRNAERLRREEEAVQRRQRDAEERRLAAERATPDYQAKSRAERERGRNLLADLKQRMGTGRRP